MGLIHYQVHSFFIFSTDMSNGEYMGHKIVEAEINGINISIETGKIAKQTAGSAIVRIGDTMLLTTACCGKAKDDIDFFPLTVEYIAKTYAAGKIPGGFFKREGKPSEDEILSARLVDRPIRPLFPENYFSEVQLVNTVISADEKYSADVMAITASSVALCISKMPFTTPVAGVRIGLIDGKFKVFPTFEEQTQSEIDLVVAGTEDSIMMVEGGAHEVKESVLVEAIMTAHEHIKALIKLQKDLISQIDIPEKTYTAPEADNPAILEDVKEIVGDRLHEASFVGIKQDRYGTLDKLLEEVQEKLAEKYPDQGAAIGRAFHKIEYLDMRETILETRKRIGGRGLDEIRAINVDLDLLPRAHGSALFTRGETQSLGVTTLGTKMDEQRIENIQSTYTKSYMLHYNFPGYSVGECKRFGSVSRREIGHGHLAERALAPILPNESSFPYTIRIVSEIMESNGSSSMATVCSGSLSLMAAGVPIKSHVAGVAMGLIKDGDRVAVLTDILGTEDHMGDMDFKVTGTHEGVTAIQMDIKIDGITPELMEQALDQARDARVQILNTMEEAIPQSRTDLSAFAPRITSIQIDKSKIGELIGPGGKIIRELQESTNTTISINDDGVVQVFAVNQAGANLAKKRIAGILAEPEVGAVYEAKIKTVVDFGAFAEYLPGKEGLIHISELAPKRVAKVDDIVKVGDVVKVKLIGLERNGKVRLSIKALAEQQEEEKQ